MMTTDEIIDKDEVLKMARQADFCVSEDGSSISTNNSYGVIQYELEAFAKLVAAKVRKATLEEMIYEHPTTAIKKAVAYEREGLVRIIEANIAEEREACAKLCEDLDDVSYPTRIVFPSECARAIRARGTNE